MGEIRKAVLEMGNKLLFYPSCNSGAFEVNLNCLLVSAFSFVLELAVTRSSVSFLKLCWQKVINHDFIYSLHSNGVIPIKLPEQLTVRSPTYNCGTRDIATV